MFKTIWGDPTVAALIFISRRRYICGVYYSSNVVHTYVPFADLQVVSTRAAFSDEFAAQYASCLFYKADGTKVRSMFFL